MIRGVVAETSRKLSHRCIILAQNTSVANLLEFSMTLCSVMQFSGPLPRQGSSCLIFIKSPYTSG